MAIRGNYDASSDLFPATGGSGSGGAILAGDIWYISVSGVLASVAVGIGASIRALSNAPGQAPTSWSINQPQKARILIRCDTTANWTAENPVLGKGEIAITIDPGLPPKMKVGDGETAWTGLTYLFTPVPDTHTFNAYTDDHTLTVDDVCTAANGLPIVTMNKATVNDLIVPDNADIPIPIGSVVKIMQTGLGQTSLVEGSVSVHVYGIGLNISAQYGYVDLIKYATNSWYAKGDLSA